MSQHFVFLLFFFFFNDTATTEIYTLSLHDALPIFDRRGADGGGDPARRSAAQRRRRSEEHTSELQSRFDLVCRLLLEKKKPSRAILRASALSGRLYSDPSSGCNDERIPCLFFFCFNDPATPEIYTLSLHDALPISHRARAVPPRRGAGSGFRGAP